MAVASALNIEALRQLARRRLPRFVYDYIEGGAEDEVTLRRNREVFEHVQFRPRTLVDASKPSARRSIFGIESAMPAAVGPTGLAGLCWVNGDLALARASAAYGVPFVLSAAAMNPIDEVRKAVPDARLWFQSYVFKDRAISDGMMRRAADAGYEALVLTTDVPVSGKRERDFRNGFKQPIALTWSARLDILLHPRWLLTVARHQPRLVNVERELEGKLKGDVLFPSLFDPGVVWDDLARVREKWPRKLLVKGILRAEDAVRAVELGADGVVVSNHGGRQLDGAPSALEVLPDVVRAIGGRATILVDGGIRRGSDIAKAIALGADGVHLGRAPLYGLAAAGERGVEKALSLLGEELHRCLALLGCPRLAEIDASFVTFATPR
jgi:(S)-mandelate dehydrogenase